MSRARQLIVALAILASAAPAPAQLASKRPLLLEENFQKHAVYTKDRLPLRDGWDVRVAHGLWQRTAEGSQSTWETGHSPVLVRGPRHLDPHGAAALRLTTTSA